MFSFELVVAGLAMLVEFVRFFSSKEATSGAMRDFREGAVHFANLSHAKQYGNQRDYVKAASHQMERMVRGTPRGFLTWILFLRLDLPF